MPQSYLLTLAQPLIHLFLGVKAENATGGHRHLELDS